MRSRETGAFRPLLISLSVLSRYFKQERAQDLLNDLDVPVSVKLLMFVIDIQVRGRYLSKLAKAVLYVRGHWLRMPFFMLVKHLMNKAFRKPSKQLPRNFLHNDLID